MNALKVPGYWAHQPRGWRDVLRCMAGQHRPAVSIHLEACRCTCGAIRLWGSRYWLSGGLGVFRLVSRRRSARLLEQDREVERARRAMWRQIEGGGQ